MATPLKRRNLSYARPPSGENIFLDKHAQVRNYLSRTNYITLTMKKILIQTLSAVAVLAIAAGCVCKHCTCKKKSGAETTKAVWGTLPDGQKADIYTLSNAKGSKARISNYGGLVVSLTAPDKNGNYSDITLGYDDLAGYLKESPYFGALIGRFGNRIAKGQYTLNGQKYTCAVNNGVNSLHGGLKGFDKVLWNAKPITTSKGPALELTYVSKDGEEGYPGNLSVTAVYTLTDENALRVDFTATTDKDTVVNLTYHGYWNLAGKGDILNHTVYLNADKFTPVDSTLIPLGELRPVKGTPFDFTTPTTIGARIGQDDEQLKFGGGYDHNWVINNPNGKMTLQARVTEPTTGRILEVSSTEPGLQFYTGNFLDGKITGKNGIVYNYRNAFVMEPQHFPDSPNQPNFPSVVLKPGQVYKNSIEYKFSAK